jgi:hypothetical protein
VLGTFTDEEVSGAGVSRRCARTPDYVKKRSPVEGIEELYAKEASVISKPRHWDAARRSARVRRPGTTPRARTPMWVSAPSERSGRAGPNLISVTAAQARSRRGRLSPTIRPSSSSKRAREAACAIAFPRRRTVAPCRDLLGAVAPAITSSSPLTSLKFLVAVLLFNLSHFMVRSIR